MKHWLEMGYGNSPKLYKNINILTHLAINGGNQ